MNLPHALKWSLFAEVASKAVQPVLFIVLARLLTPEDFGVMTAAIMVIGFSQIFWEAGMSKAIIQRQTDVPIAANAAFWINMVLGLIIVTILIVQAERISAVFFHDDRVTRVLQVMTIQILLGALSSVHTALLQKQMDFKKLFVVRISAVAIPALASVPLAWYGFGYWALVVGALAGQLVQVIMVWRLSSWRPSWDFRLSVVRDIGRFGAWVGVSGILAWFYLWFDSLLVGMYLGSHELGIYRTGSQFAIMIFAVLFSPVTPVLYSYFSRMDQDEERLGRAIDQVIKLIVLAAIPVAVWIFLLQDQLERLIFGQNWEGIGLVLGVLALSNGLAWIVGMNGEVYRALNRPQYETLVMLLALVIYIPIYYFAIGTGFEAFVWCRLLATCVGVAIQLYLVQRIVGVKIKDVLMYILQIFATIVICTLPVNRIVLESYDIQINQPIAILVSLLLSITALYMLERNRMLIVLKNILQSR